MLGGAGVPCPKRVDSVEVRNAGAEPVTVTVVFDNHKDNVELAESIQVPAGGSHHFKEKLLDFGSWQAVAPVKSVHTQDGANTLTPSVGGIVKKLEVTVNAGGALEQGASNQAAANGTSTQHS